MGPLEPLALAVLVVLLGDIAVLGAPAALAGLLLLGGGPTPSYSALRSGTYVPLSARLLESTSR